MIPKLTTRAYAKINLGLYVVGRRADGYHELETVFQTISLHDVLTFTPLAQGIEIVADDPALPRGRANLIWQAAELLQQVTGCDQGVRVRVQKQIPIGAGLAGGSADAAASLRALNRLWNCGLSAGKLAALALQIGSDVPFCLVGGTALGRGRGERLQPLVNRCACALVLVTPAFAVSTAWAFGVLRKLKLELTKPPSPVNLIVSALEKGKLSALAAALENDLEPLVMARYPEIAEIKAALREAGACKALLTGSGSTVFGLAADRPAAQQIAARLRIHRKAWRVTVTSLV